MSPATITTVMTKDQRAWVDPRTSPCPPAVPRELATDPGEIAELIGLCRRGLVYAVERWIQDGKPLQVARGCRHLELLIGPEPAHPEGARRVPNVAPRHASGEVAAATRRAGV